MKLQQDYIDAWKNVINSAIVLKLEYTNNAGFLANISESTPQNIRNMIELSIKTYLQQNKFLFDTVTMTKQSFTIFNNVTTSFTDLNKEIIDYLMSTYEPKLRM
ncbi:MAG: hypothetical protein OEL84_08375 [Nitrosopumilus sp.]|nr:hypothetical protein [Nitrosopumilus sp.]